MRYVGRKREFDLYIVTVRHTGTHFGFNFLTNIGKVAGVDYFHMHVSPQIDTKFSNLQKAKTIFTARDPYLGALRLSGRMDNVSSSQQNVDKLASEWNHFLTLYPKLDYHFLDIGCRESDRYNHLCDLANYVGVDPDDYPDLQKFADTWLPANVNTENQQYKEHYLATGELPSKIDYSGLDLAYEWYANLKTNDK